MRRVLVAALLMTAGLAHARDWEQANNKVETCSIYGRIGELYLRVAQQGKRPTMHDEAAALEVMRQHIEDEIYSNTAAYDRETAARWAMSYCLDHSRRRSTRHSATGSCRSKRRAWSTRQ